MGLIIPSMVLGAILLTSSLLLILPLSIIFALIKAGLVKRRWPIVLLPSSFAFLVPLLWVGLTDDGFVKFMQYGMMAYALVVGLPLSVAFARSWFPPAARQ